MKAILGHPYAFVSWETLQTVFAEVVGILNTHPLCPSSDDSNDWVLIKPCHLLQERQCLAIPPGTFNDKEVHSRKQWRRGKFLSNHFWTRWVRKYLPLLQERKKWILERRNLAVNDWVLVDDNISYRHWHLGRVTRVFPGADGFVWTAEVKDKSSVLIRSIFKLCLLEEAT